MLPNVLILNLKITTLSKLHKVLDVSVLTVDVAKVILRSTFVVIKWEPV